MAATQRQLRILHVGSGFRPLRRGGLIAYIEDLIAEQVRQGHEVSYFFAGRYFRWPRKPFLKRWETKGAAMLELVNSPLDDHGAQPELELDEPRCERIFRRALQETRPDVVHVQELAGLPSSVLDLARESGATVVMTLQDYFAVCPTFKLLDGDDCVCERAEIAEECVAALRSPDRQRNLLYEATVRHELYRRRPLYRLGPERREALVNRIANSPLAAAPRPGTRELPPLAAFQRRREITIERMNRIDRVIAMSSRVAELHAERGLDRERLETMQLTLSHIEKLTPREPRGQHGALTVATLGGGESPAKGSDLLLAVARELSAELGSGRLRIIVFGHLDDAFAAEAETTAGLELGGLFTAEQLESVLEPIDVGLMPSVWEEAYGYAGMEFIARGIPVISNRIGGMPDYVREGVSGWLNDDCSAGGFAAILRSLTEDPARVLDRSRSTLLARDELVLPAKRHAEETEAMYRELLAAR